MFDSDSEEELPPGWEERATADGNIYYVNHTTRLTQWIHPRTGKKKYVPENLPFGWKKFVNDDGKISFRHEDMDVTTYSDPRLVFAQESKDHIRDVRFKFDGSSTALQVLHGLDLSNKIAVVTGANSGIGFETAYSLAMHDCHVIFACRSMSAAQEAIAKIKLKRNSAKCTALRLDLASLKSVEEFVVEYKRKFDRCDILVLNAGVLCPPFSLTEDGYEHVFQVCHLSHFYLAQLLEQEILKNYHARIVILSSESHRLSNLTEDNFDEETLSPTYDRHGRMMTYNNAKLCNLLFATELHNRWYAKGVNVFAVHPGNVVYTNLTRHWWFMKLIYYICRPFTKSLQQAASTSVFCATSPSLSGISGVYFNNCFPCEPSKIVTNHRLSRKLWLLSETMIRNALENKNSITQDDEECYS